MLPQVLAYALELLHHRPQLARTSPGVQDDPAHRRTVHLSQSRGARADRARPVPDRRVRELPERAAGAHRLLRRHLGAEHRLGRDVQVRRAGQSPDRPVDAARVGDPLSAPFAEHPGRVPHLDPRLVHRRRPGAAVVVVDDPAARLLHAPVRQDHRRLGAISEPSRGLAARTRASRPASRPRRAAAPERASRSRGWSARARSAARRDAPEPRRWPAPARPRASWCRRWSR